MSDNDLAFAVEGVSMRIDEIASYEGTFPSGTRLMALLAVVGHKSPMSGLPSPIYGEDGTYVYAFPLASEAVLAALGSLSLGAKCVAAVWLGEVRPDSQLLQEKARRAAECAEFGEPGQVVLTLAVAETARELLPEGARIMELGNRSTSGGTIERLFVIQGPSQPNSSQTVVRERDVPFRFIGRSRELSELEDRITRYRLITVSGPAGVGKTTLVRRALDVVDPVTNSWYLDASGLASPTLLASALTATLEIHKKPLQTHLEALLAGAEDLDGVLGIDTSARELPEVRNIVRRLLAIAPNLAIVVVAPRSLRLPNESVIQLRGLDHPKGPENWYSLREYDALAYFESRAVPVTSDFALSQENADTIAVICRRLEGNPAAISLAVNKLRVLSPRQILDRLDQPLVFLKGANEQELERHQSLHMMIAVTVAPLSEVAKSLLGCLSVVEGAAGFDDVEVMFPNQASLPAFEELVDAGLLDVSGACVDVKRFTMSPSIRHYAKQSISQKELEKASESRLAYYEQVAVQSAAGLAGRDQAAWTRRMEEQCADIGSTARVLIKNGELERACMMLVSGITFWFERNFPSEALALAEEILKNKLGFPSRARMENFAAVMALRLGDTRRAEVYAKRGLERAISIDNKRFQIFLYGTLGMIAHAKCEFRLAVQNHREASNISRECGEKTALYNSLTNMIGSENASGSLEENEEPLKEALGLETEHTPTSWKSRFRNNMADFFLRKGDHSRSKSFVREALELLRESGHWLSAALTVRTLAHVLIHENRHEEAAQMFGGATALVERDEGRLTDYERGLTEDGIRLVTAVIGEEKYRLRFNEGRMLEAEEILRLALRVADS